MRVGLPDHPARWPRAAAAPGRDLDPPRPLDAHHDGREPAQAEPEDALYLAALPAATVAEGLPVRVTSGGSVSV